MAGYGSVYTSAGNVEWYFDGFSAVIVESHGLPVIPIAPDAEVMLCEYFG